MLYQDFQGIKLSALGFGTMRLPQKEDGSIDVAHTEEMVRYALENGVNYFDTAYPYHGGMSEVVIGAALKKYPRESYYLATKYPGHQISESYDPAAIFEEQLEKCGVDYFDFYLLHNLNESSISIYLDPKWGIIPYFLEQKRLGRIRHLGFSCHGAPDNLEAFLKDYGKEMEFCQIQLNYLDWTLQDAKKKCEILAEWKIPVWVMEPVRGGKLAKLSPENEEAMKTLRPDESIPAWAFRWMQTVPKPTMVLSGMSSLAQMEDNIKTYSEEKPLSQEEIELVQKVADELKGAIPCTACRYCCDGCPMGLDIPELLSIYNDMKISPSVVQVMRLDGLAPEKRPSACIGCGACAAICPQGIDIPGLLKECADKHASGPSWADICRERDAAAAAARAASK